MTPTRPSPAPPLAQPDPPASPDWAKDAIWYQIFPERFRNGAPQSDPHPEDIGAEHIPGWRVSPWSMEWYGRADWEIPFRDNFWATVFHRRYGGDLVGLREQLPYLEKLGINAIYLNPVFTSPSLHKYDATCYHHIDPTLGPDRDGDLAALAAAAETEDPATWIWTAADRFFLGLLADLHARGMRLILDGVFNHSGTRCFAFLDLIQNGKQSKYADWYRITKWHPDGTFDYAGWGGHPGLPEFGRTGDNLNPGIKQYIFDATRRWMDPSGQGRPEEGIDGWRLDVAFCVPHGFWREWHARVRSINPDAYTTGEIVGPAQPWIQPDEFSAVMNYEWTYPTLAFFTTHADSIDAAEFRTRIDTLLARHSPGTALIMQNLLDSHDTGRILTLLESACPPFTHWDEYFNWPKAADNPLLQTRRPGPDATNALKRAAVWQFTGPGAPMIYYGTEVGLWGANDPCDRQPMLWSDIPAHDETQGFHAPLPAPCPRNPDFDLLAFYQKLIALRKAQPALRRGSFHWLPSPDRNTLAFERTLGPDTLWCFIHKGENDLRLDLPRPTRNLWTGADLPSGPHNLPAHSVLLLSLKPDSA
ncbi:MAG: alpha-amylase [Lentisphaerae bacterium]|nr:alpha-amylase [Lentisphaerota bacterium]